MKLHAITLASAASLIAAPVASAASLDFNNLPKGTIAKGQLAAAGVTFTAKIFSNLPQFPIIFDSHSRKTPDPDLEGDTWSVGNLAPVTNLDNFLIIPQDVIDKNNDGRVDNPNDNGDQPAGSMFFNFTSPLSTFGFDLVDIDGPSEFPTSAGYVAFFSGTSELKRVRWSEFISSSSPFFDPTVKYGDHSANRIKPFTLASLGIAPFDRVEINMGGSGGIDNINFTNVPEPTGIALAALGLGAMLCGRRRSRGATV